MIPVFTPIAYTLLQSRCEFLVVSALRLRPTLCASFPFTWVIEDCAIRSSEQIRETRIESNLSVGSALDGMRLRVNEQAEIPTRCTLDDAAALNLPLGNVLLVETNAPQPGDRDASIFRRTKGIRKRNRRQPIVFALKSRLVSDLLEASLPCGVRHRQHALQRVTRDSHLLAVVRKQVLKIFR